ncbi:MAG: hypothetical protein HYX60_05810 [Legionella longbeachae]|nr:hypothetical protein [Legionella longbeachae]
MSHDKAALKLKDLIPPLKREKKSLFKKNHTKHLSYKTPESGELIIKDKKVSNDIQRVKSIKLNPPESGIQSINSPVPLIRQANNFFIKNNAIEYEPTPRKNQQLRINENPSTEDDPTPSKNRNLQINENPSTPEIKKLDLSLLPKRKAIEAPPLRTRGDLDLDIQSVTYSSTDLSCSDSISFRKKSIIFNEMPDSSRRNSNSQLFSSFEDINDKSEISYNPTPRNNSTPRKTNHQSLGSFNQSKISPRRFFASQDSNNKESGILESTPEPQKSKSSTENKRDFLKSGLLKGKKSTNLKKLSTSKTDIDEGKKFN